MDPSIAVAALRTSPQNLELDLKTFGFIYESIITKATRSFDNFDRRRIFLYTDHAIYGRLSRWQARDNRENPHSSNRRWQITTMFPWKIYFHSNQFGKWMITSPLWTSAYYGRRHWSRDYRFAIRVPYTWPQDKRVWWKFR